MDQRPAPEFAEIHGTQYETVASRVRRFRHDHPDGSITCLVELLQETIIARAKVYIRTPMESDLMHLADGTAEEIRGSSQINKTSAVENAETSAIGRALGLAGWDATGNVATAEEVANAIHQQNEGHDQTQARGLTRANKPQIRMILKLLEARADREDLSAAALTQQFLDHYQIATLEELPGDKADNFIRQYEILEGITQ